MTEAEDEVVKYLEEVNKACQEYYDDTDFNSRKRKDVDEDAEVDTVYSMTLEKLFRAKEDKDRNLYKFVVKLLETEGIAEYGLKRSDIYWRIGWRSEIYFDTTKWKMVCGQSLNLDSIWAAEKHIQRNLLAAKLHKLNTANSAQAFKELVG
jgi:hypothetical protein